MSTTQLWHDPIVSEIYATRKRLAKLYHNDLAAYSQAAEMYCRAFGVLDSGKSTFETWFRRSCQSRVTVAKKRK